MKKKGTIAVVSALIAIIIVGGVYYFSHRVVGPLPQGNSNVVSTGNGSANMNTSTNTDVKEDIPTSDGNLAVAKENEDVVFDSTVEIEDKGIKVKLMKEGSSAKFDTATVEEFEIAFFSMAYDDVTTSIFAEVKNNSEKDYREGVEMYLFFYSEDGNLICRVPAMTGSLMAGGISSLRAKVTMDCTNASMVSIQLEK